MKKELVNPFTKAVTDVMECMMNETPVVGETYLRSDKPAQINSEIAIVMGIGGKIAGHLVMSMDNITAKRMAARLMEANDGDDILLEDAVSALAEITNILTANATISLADAGYACEITPPTVAYGPRLQFIKKFMSDSVVLPISLSFGELEIDITVSETNKAWLFKIGA